MRLIDADNLMDLLRANKYNPFGLNIEDVPTVEAIPIEWIKKYLTKIEPDPDFPDFRDVIAIEDMLEGWEEEQARLFEKQITEECISAERFADWEKENDKDSE